jgi:hypothetical protein
VARKRLRTFLEEVIGDAELRASVERVASQPSADAPPLALASGGGSGTPMMSDVVVAGDPAEDAPVVPLRPAAFPAPPWQAPSAGLPDDAPNGPTATTSAAPSVDLPPAAADAPPAALDAPHPAAAIAVGSAAEHTHANRRRRRSASLLPPLPSPTDIPEDAAGRVAIMAIASPPDAVAEPEMPSPAVDPGPAPVTTVAADAPLSGWLPVLALGVALVVVFVIGVLVTR